MLMITGCGSGWLVVCSFAPRRRPSFNVVGRRLLVPQPTQRGWYGTVDDVVVVSGEVF